VALDPRVQAEIVVNLMAWDNVEPRRMFGSDTYLVGGRLFAIFTGDGVAVKVPSLQREELLKDPRVGPFTAGQGRAFGEWLHIRLSEPHDVALALLAVEGSYRYVQTAPAKTRRRRK
jgi:TfoX/Sxy family transcriptional regulator of competence genes